MVREKLTVDALKQYFDVLATKNDGLRNLENNENAEKPNDFKKDKENGDEKNKCENAGKGTNIVTQNEVIMHKILRLGLLSFNKSVTLNAIFLKIICFFGM